MDDVSSAVTGTDWLPSRITTGQNPAASRSDSMMGNSPQQANTRLTQTVRFDQQRRFEFVGRRRLRVSERSARGSRSYVIDITVVDPRGRSVVRVPWNRLGLVIAGVTAALISWMVLDPDGMALTLVLAACGLMAMAGLVLLIRGTTKRRVFVSCHARLPLLDLELNRPDTKQFTNFVTCLEKRISDAREQLKLEKDQYVAGEIRMLRRLAEAGVFEVDVYERAKSELLGKF